MALQKRQQPHSTAEELPDIAALRKTLNRLPIAGTGVHPFAGLPVQPFAFFPGGNGMVHGAEATRFPVGGTLVLGSNWGCASGFVDEGGLLLRHDEREGPTWSPLLRRLRATDIDPARCFFSNVWPFLHKGTSNFGPMESWLRDSKLTVACNAFLDATILRMRPRLIVALGRGPAAFLAQRWPDPLRLWRGFSLQAMDQLPYAVVPQASAVCVALTHPSMPMNARLRQPPYTGSEGEDRLLADAKTLADAQIRKGLIRGRS